MIIIIAVVVALGVYEIGNSVRFDINGQASYNTDLNLNNLIKNIDNNDLRKEQIYFYIEDGVITNNRIMNLL